MAKIVFRRPDEPSHKKNWIPARRLRRQYKRYRYSSILRDKRNRRYKYLFYLSILLDIALILNRALG